MAKSDAIDAIVERILAAGVPRTRVTLRSFYASDADRKRHLEDFQAAAGARQLLERLERVATRG
ncbi:MAG TPA: hypothetical protein VES42_06785 [Pilimelia sp.]|nr:hypothetical protein [Pilimelia sp.]